MTWARWSRAWPLAGALAAMLLGGCVTSGQSSLQADVARRRGQTGFAVADASAERAVFVARGKQVVVEPPKGYCLDEDSIAAGRRSAFALVAECLHSHQRKLANNAGNGESGEVELPRAFPGILTVSISGEPAYGTEPGALDDFEALLETQAGQRLLGRGTSDGPGRIVATRRIGGALYVLVHEPGDEDELIMAPNFWRAFVDVNDRLVLVTVSSFVDRPMAEDAMMGFLAQQLDRLRRANGLARDREEQRIAAAMAKKLPPPEVVALQAEGEPEASGSATGAVAGAIAPGRAPLPRERIASVHTGVAAPAAAPASGRAPARAPLAPVRPG
jgi:hypothetical protein